MMHKQSKPPIWRRKTGLLLAGGFLLSMAAGYIFWGREDIFDRLEYVDGRLLNRDLLNLPANRWLEIYPHRPGGSALSNIFSGVDWYRQGHAGMTFDSERGTLLIFGSDSHGENWDNSVHEFSPLDLAWVDHYPPSPKESYRADEQGQAIAGGQELAPWAMHSFDAISYFPEWDALVVMATKDHTNPPTEPAKQARRNPTWLYDLKTRRWTILPQEGNPSFFAAGSAYDPLTASIWAYRAGELWRLDAVTRRWSPVGGNHKTDLQIHFTMVNDTRRHQFVFFGNSGKTNDIWLYTPAKNPGQNGVWEKKQPEGDTCPKDEHLPVDYDSHQGVFLLVPDESAEKSVTLVYAPDSNRYIKIPGAEMPANAMNYMMQYDPFHRLFYLVTGDWKRPLTVWAMRLDMAALAP